MSVRVCVSACVCVYIYINTVDHDVYLPTSAYKLMSVVYASIMYACQRCRAGPRMSFLPKAIKVVKAFW